MEDSVAMEQKISELLKSFEEGKMTREQYIKSTARAAAESKGTGTAFRATGMGHMSFDVPNFEPVQSWYADLFGGTPFRGNRGTEGHVRFGDMYITFRNSPQPVAPHMGKNHIALAVEPWEHQEEPGVEGCPTIMAELKKRGIPILPGPDVKVMDPAGYQVQLIGRTFQTPY